MDPLGHIALAIGVAGMSSALGRIVSLWLRSRFSSRVRLKDQGDVLELDLSKPNEAERYLLSLTKRGRGGK